MKRFSTFILLALCACSGAQAAPSLFLNVGTISGPTNIVANIFKNEAVFDLYPTLTNGISLASDPYTGQLFQTHTTEYWTNTAGGVMSGQPGFDFLDFGSRGAVPSLTFDNAGLIQAFDVPVSGFYFIAGSAGELEPTQLMPAGVNAPVPSDVVVSAASIQNTGTMQVGDNGLLQLTGKNVVLSGGTLLAGTVDESPSDPEATMARGLQNGLINGGTLYPAFAPPVDVYDIYWGYTNGASFNGDLEDLADTYVSPSEVELAAEAPIIFGSRNGTLEGEFLADAGGIYAVDVFPLSGGLISLNGVTAPTRVILCPTF